MTSNAITGGTGNINFRSLTPFAFSVAKLAVTSTIACLVLMHGGCNMPNEAAGYTISGKIVPPRGMTAAGIEVQVQEMSQSWMPLSLPKIEKLDAVTTDDTGFFMVKAVSRRRYLIVRVERKEGSWVTTSKLLDRKAPEYRTSASIEIHLRGDESGLNAGKESKRGQAAEIDI